MTTVGSVLSLLTRGITNSLAHRFGGTPAAVQTGIGTCANAIVVGAANRSSDTTLMARIFDLARNSTIGSLPGNLRDIALGTGAPAAEEQSQQLVALIFRNKKSDVEKMIGRFSGLGAFAGSELMSIAAPLTLAVLGQRIHEEDLSPSSFSTFIASEAEKIKELVPTSLSNLLTGSFIPATDSIHPNPSQRTGLLKEAFALIGMVALGLIVWPLSGGCDRGISLPDPPSVIKDAAAPGTLNALILRRLPNGTQLNIPPQGIESKLIDFVEDSSKAADKTTWFDFDRLTFDTGSDKLQPSSNEQLQKIAAILQAYPSVHAKVGGYTDNTGNATANLKLSGDRAANVMHELINRGITPARLEAKGYGEEHPVADNSTAEGRQMNRRISLLVTAK